MSHAVDNRMSGDESEDDILSSAHPSMDYQSPAVAATMRAPRLLGKIAKTKGKRLSNGSAASKSKLKSGGKSRTKRAPLREITNTGNAEAQATADERDALEKNTDGIGAVTATATTTKPRGRPKTKPMSTDDLESPRIVEAISNMAKSRRAGEARPKPTKKQDNIEKQADAEADTMDLEDTPAVPTNTAQGMNDEDDKADDLATTYPQTSTVSSTSPSASDPVQHRRIDDLKRKLDNLTDRYNKLREIGIVEAQANYDKLKEQAEKRSQDAENLIASLKQDLASKTSATNEVALLRAQVASLTIEKDAACKEAAATAKHNAVLVKEAQDHSKSVDDLRRSLETAQNENHRLQTALSAADAEMKQLKTRLATSRAPILPTLEAQEPGRAVPGSALKTSAGPKPNTASAAAAAAAAAATASEEVRKLRLKEDLYCDITGLVIADIKRVPPMPDSGSEIDEDRFECWQTGRNGTLRFSLSVQNPSKPPEGWSFDDAEFYYEPVLDEKNDRRVIECLLDPLTEGIAFPRSSASRFYGRVVKSLDQRIGEEDPAD